MPLPSAIGDPLEDAFYRLATFGHTRPKLFAAASASLVGVLLLLPPAYRSYRGYLALGPGGISHNVWGWLYQGMGQLFALRDPRSTSDFEKPSPAVIARYGGSARAQKSYLDIDTTLPARQGPRPTIPGYTAPQRQTTDIASDPAATRAAQEAFLEAVAAANPDLLEIRPSALEGNETPALWAKDAVILGAKWSDPDPTKPKNQNRDQDQDQTSTKGDKTDKEKVKFPRAPVEICHAHPEASSHMQFSFGDAYWVVKAGWGERHLMAGSPAARIPPTYLIVYVPRDERELQVWKELVMAAVRFSVGEDVDVNDVKK
ncbi:uncharacterized protein SPSK_01232 [Sporothrix schenckii 1099-18]|uniref:Luciferase domain-containing protein n=1 Tax=Sporothrix schenckii 1099-18 TaxID=1397361 RepID=A0A0F2LV74_SPOSC|nr:uncharacterized protein SPSK_01232 [Sporothrix schenckii 1099-18]KJR81363.1 hypothetical protein SPSK_01232 [Sporothrix schenckii 1099-18]